MPTDIIWIQRPHILGITYQGNITAEEINESSREALTIAETQPLYILADMSRVTAMPRNLTNVSFRAEHFIPFIKHVNTRAFAFLRANTLTRLTLEIVLRGQHVLFTDDHDEAINFLREQFAADNRAE